MPPTLTEADCRSAKPREKPYKLAAGGALYLEVFADGAKRWRWKYRVDGREKRLALGVYGGSAHVSLKMAREGRDSARQQLKAGIDPSAAKQATKLSNAGVDSFEAVAREWHSKFAPSWVASHSDRILRRLEVDIFPWLGKKPISEVKASEVLACLRRIEQRGAIETAHRAMQNCGQIFRYAVSTTRMDVDPTSGLRGALPPPKEKHHASITDPSRVGELMRALESYRGFFPTQCALRLAPLVFVRPGELRKATWDEIDLEKAEWRIPASRMKMRELHIVPLSKQAVEILQELKPLTGGRISHKPEMPVYVFPGGRTRERPMSEAAVLAALRRMGYSKEEMTGHGFRSMASTLLHEQGWNHQVIERQLAHAERNAVSAAYNYAEHLPARREMMQAWSDYLDNLKIIKSANLSTHA